MVASSTISLDSFLMSDLHDTNEFQCHDITMDPIDPSRFYVASDGGMVLHGSTQADHRPSPRLFKPEIGKQNIITWWMSHLSFSRNIFKCFQPSVLSLWWALHAAWVRGWEHQTAQHQQWQTSDHMGWNCWQWTYCQDCLVNIQTMCLLHSRHSQQV